MRRVALAGALTVALVGSVSACTESGEPEAPPTDDVDQWYIDQIDEILAYDDLPDFTRGVLEDYWVTDAELQEAKDRFHQCIEDKGYEAKTEFRGRFLAATLSDADHQKLVEQYQNDPDAGLTKELSIVNPCTNVSTSYVAELYVLMRDNPENLSRNELLRRCLEKVSAADKARSITDDEIIDAVRAGKLGDNVKEHCQNYVYQE